MSYEKVCGSYTKSYEFVSYEWVPVTDPGRGGNKLKIKDYGGNTKRSISQTAQGWIVNNLLTCHTKSNCTEGVLHKKPRTSGVS